MNFQNLKTFGLASVLILTTTAQLGNSPAIKAESLTQKSQTVLAQAQENSNFISVGSKTTNGQIRIINENGQQYIEFDQSFVTDRGPDLKVVLHRNQSVSSRIQESDYLEIAPLQNFRGTQRYLIPEEVDLSQYSSVAIWCRQFNVTFGYANLT
ncbi:MAG: DM13 domain-containing protein [Xenococcus sp. (in: cyanobacteria)]